MSDENEKIYSLKKYEYMHDKFDVYSIDEINKYRLLAGIPALKKQKRKCINCKTEIISISDRLCSKCRLNANHHSSAMIT